MLSGAKQIFLRIRGLDSTDVEFPKVSTKVVIANAAKLRVENENEISEEKMRLRMRLLNFKNEGLIKSNRAIL